jgi:hypothetical protein
MPSNYWDTPDPATYLQDNNMSPEDIIDKFQAAGPPQGEGSDWQSVIDNAMKSIGNMKFPDVPNFQKGPAPQAPTKPVGSTVGPVVPVGTQGAMINAPVAPPVAAKTTPPVPGVVSNLTQNNLQAFYKQNQQWFKMQGISFDAFVKQKEAETMGWNPMYMSRILGYGHSEPDDPMNPTNLQKGLTFMRDVSNIDPSGIMNYKGRGMNSTQRTLYEMMLHTGTIGQAALGPLANIAIGAPLGDKTQELANLHDYQGVVNAILAFNPNVHPTDIQTWLQSLPNDPNKFTDKFWSELQTRFHIPIQELVRMGYTREHLKAQGLAPEGAK